MEKTKGNIAREVYFFPMFSVMVGKMILLAAAKIISAVLILIGSISSVVSGIGIVFFDWSLLLAIIGIIILSIGIAGWSWSIFVINKIFPIKIG